MCTLVSLSFVAPCRKRILHPTNSLTNSTGRHKAHVGLYECGTCVCYLQQLPLSLCLPLYSVSPVRCSTSVCVHFRARLRGLENRIACNIV